MGKWFAVLEIIVGNSPQVIPKVLGAAYRMSEVYKAELYQV